MKIERLPIWLLNFKDMPKNHCDIIFPLIVNEQYDVLFGNSIQGSLQADADCIVLNEKNTFLPEKLFCLETALLEENDFKRWHDIQQDLNEWACRLQNSEAEKDAGLFAVEKETRTIEEAEFDCPKEFKHKEKKKKEAFTDDSLFSDFGDF